MSRTTDLSQPQPPRISALTTVLLVLVPPVAALNAFLPAWAGVSTFFVISVLAFVNSWGYIRLRTQPSRLVPWVLIASAMIAVRAVFALVFGSLDASGRNEAIVVGFGLLVTATICILPASRSVVYALVIGWLVAFLSTGILGLIEYATGKSLGPSYLDANPLAEVGIVSTFYNPNRYAAFLLLVMPLLALGMSCISNKLLRVLFALAFLTAVPLAFLTGSRLGSASAIGVLALWIMLRSSGRVVYLVLTVGVLGIVIAMNAGVDTAAFWGDRAYAIPLLGFDVGLDASLYARWAMAMNSFYFLADVPLSGVGPGGIEMKMIASTSPFDALGVINPHNGAVELISKYGLLVGAVVLGVGIALVRLAVASRPRRNPDKTVATFACALLCGIFVLPIASLLPGAMMNDPYAWVAAATLLAVGLNLDGPASMRPILPGHMQRDPLHRMHVGQWSKLPRANSG